MNYTHGSFHAVFMNGRILEKENTKLESFKEIVKQELQLDTKYGIKNAVIIYTGTTKNLKGRAMLHSYKNYREVS